MCTRMPGTRHAVESGLYGGLRAGRRRRPCRTPAEPQASARGPFAVKDWLGCRIAHPGRIGSVCQHPRLRSWRLNGCAGCAGRASRSRCVGVSPATVSRVLRRLGLNKLSALEPAEPVRRYEREHSGELISTSRSLVGSAPSGIASQADKPAWSIVTSALAGSTSTSASMIPCASPSCRSWPISAKNVRSLFLWPPSPITQSWAFGSNAS
jgi:hypothetical protein